MFYLEFKNKKIFESVIPKNYNEIFQQLHFYLNNNKNIDMAFYPYLTKDTDFVFRIFSETESVVKDFLVYLELKLNLNNLTIELKESNIEPTIFFQRKLTSLDRIAYSRFKSRVNYVIRNKEKEFKKNSFNYRIKELLDLMNLDKEEIEEKTIILDLRERFKRFDIENIPIYINSKSTNNKGVRFNIEKKYINSENLINNSNEYGLSTTEKKFYLPELV